MPIELITGLPGTSKTTRLVQRMLDESRKENPRPLVAMGVNGLKPGLAQVLDDPTRWAEIVDREEGPCTCPLIGGEPRYPKGDGSLGFHPHTHRIPMGALVFVDEAWKWFGHLQDASRQATPKHVLQLAEHRHMGIDFVWTTQMPAQIYPFARGQIATHTHLVRKFGTRFCDKFTWGELQEDVKSDGKRLAALRETDRMPSEAQEWFVSAQEHTIKRNVPWRVVALPGLFIAAALCAWLAFVYLRPSAIASSLTQEGPGSALADPAQPVAASRGNGDKEPPATPAEYAAAHLPRFATMPHTAQIFDSRAPVSDPLLMCMSSPGGIDANGDHKDPSCTCFTEQGTLYEIGDGECRRVARWGQPYNPYRATPEQRRDARDRDPGQGSPAYAGAPPASAGGVVGAAARPAAYGSMRQAQW